MGNSLSSRVSYLGLVAYFSLVAFPGCAPKTTGSSASAESAEPLSVQAFQMASTPSPINFADNGFESPNVGVYSFYSFTNDPTGTAWNFSSLSGVAGNGSGFTGGNANAPQGTQVGFIQETGSFSQTLAPGAGTYVINFQAANRVNWGGSLNFEVLVDGSNVGTFTATSNWAAYTTNPFTLTSGNHTFTFQGINSAGGDDSAFFDEVSLGIISSSTPVSGGTNFADNGFESPNVGVNSYSSFVVNPSGSGWTFSATSGISGNGSGFTGGNANAPQGTQVGFIQETGSFSQTLAPGAGTYAVTFEAANRVNWGGSLNFEVLVDGANVGTFTANSNWTPYTTNSFTLTSGNHTFTFQGINSAGGDDSAFFDEVSLVGSTSSTPPPTNSGAPSEAQMAGFTTLAADYDFSQSLYATQSNWYDCNGSLPNVPFHQGNPGVTLDNPCNVNQIVDGSSTVMDFQYLTSYESHNYGGQFNQVGGQTWNNFKNAQGADYPNMYIETVARVARTFGQPANSGGPNDVWTWGDSANADLEIDVFELYEDQNGFGNAGAINHSNNVNAATWQSYEKNNLPSGWLPTVYHKYGALLTSDGATKTYVCTFVDDLFQACGNVSGSPVDVEQFTTRNRLIISAGSNSDNAAADIDMYVQYVKVWTCPNWQGPNGNAGTMCNGSSLVNGGNGLTYWK